MSNAPRGDILTTFQAARLCGVSHKSIERWIDAGLLPGFRTPGGHRRVHRSDLLGFVQARRTTEPHDLKAGRAADSNPRVLVVDDDPAIRELFVDYFRSALGHYYVLEVASSGYEAGLMVERFRPHVVVLDLMMPDLNGFEVCERTRRDPAHAAIAFIALTGSERAGERASESELFHRVFLKPVKLGRVKEAIDELLAERGFAAGAVAS
jgi:excisionase family DNA binding protein